MSETKASQWQALRQKYLAGLPERARQLQEAWNQYCQDSAASGGLDVLSTISHKLAGSGEVYGFASLSSLARQLELALKAPADRPLLEAALSALLTCLADCINSTPQSAGQPNASPVDEPSPPSRAVVISAAFEPRVIPASHTGVATVVLADDDSDFGHDLVRVLQQQNFHVVWIEDIKALPAAVEQYKPLAAIVDMVFPEGRLAGAESILQLRGRSGPPLPVIFISACRDFDVRLASVRAGGSHFFTKPVRNDQLVKTLRALVGIETREPYRVLLVDDDVHLLDLYREVLQEAGFQVFSAPDAIAGMALLQAHDPELILLDLNMPGCSGLELGQIIRQHEEYASTPILFMSADSNSDVQMACVRLAGDEFITKPIEPWRLLMAVESRVKRSRMLRQHVHRTQDVMPLAADYDLLTALPGLRRLHQQLEHRLDLLKSGGAGFALMKLDLDDFHTINDVYGHDVGDQLIQRLAWVISHQLQQDDFLCRDSGDEFWIILAQNDNATNVVRIVESILTAVRQPFAIAEKSLAVSASIGVAIAPQDGFSGEELLKNVDTALFHAKREVGGSYCFFAARMQEDILRQHTLEQALKIAIAQHQFVVHYQPIFAAHTRQLAGFEALVRWQHPQRGLLFPGEFMDVVENRGMSRALTRQVMEIALRQIKRWRSTGFEWFISINLAAADVQDSELVKEIEPLLSSLELDASAVWLELTESMLISDWTVGGDNLRRLSELGVQLAIDDFGTGYSSLSYLNKLPVNKLKIDRSFVSNWSHRQDDRLIRSIVNLGSNLGLDVVAEGVEQVEQLTFLEALGCQQFQGYLASKPMAPEAIESSFWFRQGLWQTTEANR